MNWLRRKLRRWIYDEAVPEPIGHGANGLLGMLAAPDNPSTYSVMRIDNGFLVMRRKYNPNGPDAINAVFAADAEQLTNTLVAQMTAHRINP